MSETRYPSHAEVQRILEPKITAIRQKTLYAEFKEPSQPAIRYLNIVGAKGAPPVNVLDESIQLLRNIRDFPSDGLKRRYDSLKWGIEKGNKRLRELTNAGYVVVTKVPCSNPKGGRARLVASITLSGKEFLDAFENQNKSENK